MWPDKCINTTNISKTVTNKSKSKNFQTSTKYIDNKICNSNKEHHLAHNSNEKNVSSENLKSCIAQRVSDIFCKSENGDESVLPNQKNKTKKLNDVSLTAFVQKCADPIDGEIYIKKTCHELVKNKKSSESPHDDDSTPNNTSAEINVPVNNICSISDSQITSSNVPLINIPLKLATHNDLCQLSTNVLPPYIPSFNSTFQKNQNSEKFNCVDCGDQFVLETSLSRHLERRSVLAKLSCESCGKLLVYYNRCALLAHIRSHQEKGECSDIRNATVVPLPRELMDGFICPASSSSSENAMAEKTDNTQNSDFQDALNKFRCPECNALVDSAKSRENHFGSNHNLPLQAAVCSKCNMTCPTKCSLIAHQRIHLRGRPYICPECGECFIGTWERFQHHLKLKCLHFSRLVGYKCSLCSILYDSTDSLQIHIIDMHSEAYYKCQACPMAFKAPTTFDTHRKSAHPTTEIQCTIITKCPLCDTVFHSKEILQTHLQAHIKDQLHNTKFVFKCPECEELLETKPSLSLHIQQFHPHLVSQKVCSQCGLTFSTSRGLKEHTKDVHQGRNGHFTTKCGMCHRKFQTIHGYRIHRQRCHGTLTLRCATCGETSVNKIELASHGMQHLKEGIHVCLVCNNEKYSDSNALLTHLQHHAKNAKYPNQCLQCMQTLNDAKEAFSHLKEEHKLTVFHCTKCDISYESSVRLARHHKVMHEEFGLKKRHVCWICKEYGFSKRAILKRHITSKHSIPEDEIDFSQAPYPPIKIRIPLLAVKRHYSCDDKLSSQDTPLAKKCSNVNKQYVCAKCDFRSSDSSSFKEHIIIHKTEKASFQCTECGSSFVVEPSLRRHLLIAHKIHDVNRFLSKTNKPSKNSNGFECKVCFETFENNDLLQTHLRIHGMAFIQSAKSRTAMNNHSSSSSVS